MDITNPTSIIEGIGGNSLSEIKFDLAGILKLPIVVILFGNILFAALLFLRTRILTDTFDSSQTGIIKVLMSIYLIVTIIGSILAVLFLLIG